jgi:hypothetical protein
MNALLEPAEKDDVVNFKLSIKLGLKTGDYFMTLGIAEGLEHTMLVARYGIIHLSVGEKNYFDGIVELDTTFQEISRIKSKFTVCGA